jgi:hypothetical protein
MVNFESDETSEICQREVFRTTGDDNRKDYQKILINLYIEEYRSLKEEQAQHYSTKRQLALFGTASASAIIPIIVSLLEKSQPELLMTILLVMPFVFNAIAFAFLGVHRWVQVIGEYIFTELQPELTKLVDSLNYKDAKITILNYEHYVRLNAKRYPLDAALSALLNVGELTLILLPTILSMAAFYYVSYSTPIYWLNWQRIIVIINYLVIFIVIALAVYIGTRPLRHMLNIDTN